MAISPSAWRRRGREDYPECDYGCSDNEHYMDGGTKQTPRLSVLKRQKSKKLMPSMTARVLAHGTQRPRPAKLVN